MEAVYAELHLHTPYSYLDGGSGLEALIRRAASFGMPALAMTDHDNTAAAVKFVITCHAYQILPILGAELTMDDNTHLTLLARNREGYGNLCCLITAGYAHGGRLTPRLPWRALGIEGWEVPMGGWGDGGMGRKDAASGGRGGAGNPTTDHGPLTTAEEKRRRGEEEADAGTTHHSP